MPTSYHRFAGSSLGRLAALSDGVFAVAMGSSGSGSRRNSRAFTRSTRALTWIHLTFLLAVTLMPFSTGLLAQDTTYRAAMAVYWVNLLALGSLLYISLQYADRAGLLSAETTPEMRAALKRRIVVYQALYALATLTCLINTYLAIGLLVALQLNSVIAPRIGILDRA